MIKLKINIDNIFFLLNFDLKINKYNNIHYKFLFFNFFLYFINIFYYYYYYKKKKKKKKKQKKKNILNL